MDCTSNERMGLVRYFALSIMAVKQKCNDEANSNSTASWQLGQLQEVHSRYSSYSAPNYNLTPL